MTVEEQYRDIRRRLQNASKVSDSRLSTELTTIVNDPKYDIAVINEVLKEHQKPKLASLL